MQARVGSLKLYARKKLICYKLSNAATVSTVSCGKGDKTLYTEPIQPLNVQILNEKMNQMNEK